MFFRFKLTRQPQAGAEAYAFEPGTLNPVYPFGGNANFVNPPFHAFAEPPAYYPVQLFTIAGLGGVIAGSQYGTPLTPSTRR